MKLNCLNPSIILHPSIFDFLKVSDYIIIPNLLVSVFDKDLSSLYTGDKSFYGYFPYLPRPNNISLSDIDNYYLVDSNSCFYPLFLAVPCGKCGACLDSRHNSILQRLNLAIEEFNSLPVFVTLTYNESHLPSCGVYYRDVQLFKKKLNKLIFERYKLRLKYAVFSEYGDHGRPHYHLAIYGLPIFSNKTFYFRFKHLSQIFQFCWRTFPKKGYKFNERYNFDKFLKCNYKFFNITSFDKIDPFSNGFVNVEFPRSSAFFKYVTKYISKGSNVPAGKNPNFYHLSVNLGVSFISKYRDYILHNSFLTYTSRFNPVSKPKKLYLCKYFINKLFPSRNQIFNINLRRSCNYFYELGTSIIHSDFLPSFLRRYALKCLDYINYRFPSLFIQYRLPSSFNFLSSSDFYNYYRSRYDEYFPISLDFEKDFIFLFNFLKSELPKLFDLDKRVYERDLFLSRLSNYSPSPLFSSIRYSSAQEYYKSIVKL